MYMLFFSKNCPFLSHILCILELYGPVDHSLIFIQLLLCAVVMLLKKSKWYKILETLAMLIAMPHLKRPSWRQTAFLLLLIVLPSYNWKWQNYQWYKLKTNKKVHRTDSLSSNSITDWFTVQWPAIVCLEKALHADPIILMDTSHPSQ